MLLKQKNGQLNTCGQKADFFSTTYNLDLEPFWGAPIFKRKCQDINFTWMNEWMNESVYSLKFTTFINENNVCHNYNAWLIYQYMLSNVNNQISLIFPFGETSNFCQQ